MVPEKAIEYIREHLTDLHANPDIYDDGTANVIIALEECVLEALAKEIPEEPIVKHEFNILSGREFFACPNCGEFIRYKYSEHHYGPLYPACCIECGQTLNWGKY